MDSCCLSKSASAFQGQLNSSPKRSLTCISFQNTLFWITVLGEHSDLTASLLAFTLKTVRYMSQASSPNSPSPLPPSPWQARSLPKISKRCRQASQMRPLADLPPEHNPTEVTGLAVPIRSGLPAPHTGGRPILVLSY